MKKMTQITLTLEPGRKVDPALLKKIKPLDPNPKIGTCQFEPNRETIIIEVEPDKEKGALTLFNTSRKLISIGFKNIFIETC